LIHFWIKNTLKNNHNNIPKHTLITCVCKTTWIITLRQKNKKKKAGTQSLNQFNKKKTNECPSNNETNLVCRERNSLPETLKAVQFLEVRAMAIQNPNCWDETNNINNNWEEAAESVGDKASLPPFFYNSPHKNRRKWTQSHWIFSERH
jgi:hypothetical protein